LASFCDTFVSKLFAAFHVIFFCSVKNNVNFSPSYKGCAYLSNYKNFKGRILIYSFVFL
jgi:hypothetical protein